MAQLELFCATEEHCLAHVRPIREDGIDPSEYLEPQMMQYVGTDIHLQREIGQLVWRQITPHHTWMWSRHWIDNIRIISMVEEEEM